MTAPSTPPAGDVGKLVAFVGSFSETARRPGEREKMVQAANLLQHYAAALEEIASGNVDWDFAGEQMRDIARAALSQTEEANDGTAR